MHFTAQKERIKKGNAYSHAMTHVHGTLQALYNTVRYNTDLDITQFKDGSQKCIDYIEKSP